MFVIELNARTMKTQTMQSLAAQLEAHIQLTCVCVHNSMREQMLIMFGRLSMCF
jgi:hypothetical protein